MNTLLAIALAAFTFTMLSTATVEAKPKATNTFVQGLGDGMPAKVSQEDLLTASNLTLQNQVEQLQLEVARLTAQMHQMERTARMEQIRKTYALDDSTTVAADGTITRLPSPSKNVTLGKGKPGTNGGDATATPPKK